MPAWNEAQASEIIGRHSAREGALLPILHDMQAAFGCVPGEAVPFIAEALNLTRAEVHGVISFYHDFSDKPAGRHVLKLCRAEACQSMNSEALAQKVLNRFDLEWGETTPDGRVTILMPHPERVFRSVQLSWNPFAGPDSPWMRLFRNARVWVGKGG